MSVREMSDVAIAAAFTLGMAQPLAGELFLVDEMRQGGRAY